MSTSEGVYRVKVTPRLKLSGWVLAVGAAVALGIVALVIALSTQSSTTTRSHGSVNAVVSAAPARVTGPRVVRDPQTHALLQVRRPIQTPADNPPPPVRDPITHIRLER